MSKVYIVLGHPDMTYYGDAEIHGVYETQEEADAVADFLHQRDHPNWPRDDISNFGVEPWEIGESGVAAQEVRADNNYSVKLDRDSE